MGNLRSKYTDEEWDALVEQSMKRKDIIQPKKYYRVCNKETLQGLWYDYKGQFTGLIHEEFAFCTNNKLEMDFDPEIVGWLSATDSLETLYNWFSKEDITCLQKHGWFIHEFEAVDAKFYERFQHQVINQETSKVLRVIDLNEEPARAAALANYKELYEGEPLTWEVPVDAFIKGVEWRQANTNDLFTATDMGEFALWCAKNYGYHKGYYVHKADREKKKLSINIYDLLEEFKIKRYNSNK